MTANCQYLVGLVGAAEARRSVVEGDEGHGDVSALVHVRGSALKQNCLLSTLCHLVTRLIRSFETLPIARVSTTLKTVEFGLTSIEHVDLLATAEHRLLLLVADRGEDGASGEGVLQRSSWRRSADRFTDR